MSVLQLCRHCGQQVHIIYGNHRSNFECAACESFQQTLLQKKLWAEFAEGKHDLPKKGENS